MTLGTFIPIFVIFVIVMLVVIVIGSLQSDKKKKESESRRAQEMRTRLDDEDPFSEVSGSGGSAPARKYVALKKAAPARTGKRAPVTVEGTDLYEAAPRVHTSAKVVGIAKSHHDQHCDVGHSDDELYIVEKVPVSGSIGGKSEEGCGEHYGLRFVKIDTSDESNGKAVVTPDDIRKAIILGEVINDPAYKK